MPRVSATGGVAAVGAERGVMEFDALARFDLLAGRLFCLDVVMYIAARLKSKKTA
jgi:hypothetical protein